MPQSDQVAPLTSGPPSTRDAELHDLLEAAALGVRTVALDGTVLTANQVELDLLGYAEEEYVGRPVTAFHVDADVPVATDALARLAAGERRVTYEARARCKDGSTKHVLVDAILARRDVQLGRVRCFTRDITARKHREEALRFLADASNVLASSLDYATTLAAVARLAVPRVADWAAVDMIDDDGTVRRLVAVHADPAKVARAREVRERIPLRTDAKVGPARVLRSGVAELVREVDDPWLEAALGPDAAAVARSFGLRSAVTVPLRARSRVVGALSIASAESGRRYGDEDLRTLEDLARRASAAIESAYYHRAAEEANQAKDEFLAVVSHELRTPLNAILGWVHMLRQDGTMPEDRRSRALETIERNARAQNQLIEDLLDVSRIVSGKLRLEVQPIDLAQVVLRAIETVRPAAAARAIEIHHSLDPSAGPVLGDPDRLQQVVWNLLSNALKFSGRGADVDVELRAREAAIDVVVRDRGEGIEPSFLPFVFERFRQADGRTTRARGGLGLGLAIVRNLVELHGGHVRAQSEGPGHGATFTVTLPIAPARPPSFSRPPALSLTSAAPATPAPPELVGRHVLVVDDEEDARDLVAALLEQCGARVTKAASVEEAIGLVPIARPDVVVSDIGMPGEDGYALIQRLRALSAEQGGRTPAIALTAYARTEERAKALGSGFNLHVPKPVEPAELLAGLASLASLYGAT